MSENTDRMSEVLKSEHAKQAEEGLINQIARETEARRPFAVAQECPVTRSKLEATQKIEEEMKLAGEAGFYAWDLGGKGGHVEGLTIGAAMIIMRNWGNCTVEVELTATTRNYWLFTATFIDLESGASFPRLYRQRKADVIGGTMNNDRKLDGAFQIGQSKAIRNAVLKAMPEWLKDRALAAAKEGAVANVTDLKRSIKGVVKGFKQLDATQGEMEVFMWRTSEWWTKEDVVTLAALGKAVKEGQIDVHEALKPVTEADL